LEEHALRSFTLKVLLFPLFAGVLTALPAAAQEDPARAVIQRFQQSLLAVMKEAESLGVTGRYQRLQPRIEEAFHLPLMIRVATGSFWKRATKEQQSGLVAAFKRMSISTYANRFDGYSGQVFEIVDQRPGPQKTVLVKTRIVSPGDSPARLTYVVKEFKGQWRIVDILLDNDISELAVRRSEYRRLLKENGVDGLIATLNDKAAGLVAQ
jgi:phospholipid transport system substrate-binding protein